MTQEPLPARRHSPFSLHRLEHHRAGAIGDRGLKGLRVVERAIGEPARHRFEPFVVLRLRGRRHRREGPPVKRALEGDDLALFRPPSRVGRAAAHDLDRRLVRLGSGVAEEHPIRKCAVHQILREPYGGLHVVEVARVEEAPRLAGHRRDQVRVPVAEGVDADPGAEIDILAPVDIPQAGPLAMVEHHRLGSVVGHVGPHPGRDQGVSRSLGSHDFPLSFRGGPRGPPIPPAIPSQFPRPDQPGGRGGNGWRGVDWHGRAGERPGEAAPQTAETCSKPPNSSEPRHAIPVAASYLSCRKPASKT